jgi:hypothetical protein
MSVKDRLFLIAKSKNLSIRGLERKAHLNRGVFSNMGDNTGSDKIASVLAAFPDIRAEWLLTGEGSMTKDEQLPYPIRKEEHSKLEEPVISDKKYIESVEEQNRQLKQQLEAQNKQIEALNQQIQTLSKWLTSLALPKPAQNE